MRRLLALEPHISLERRSELKSRSLVEDSIVRDKRQPEPDRGGDDATVAVVDLASQRVPELRTSLAQLGAQPDHLVVGQHGQFGESLQSATPQLTPPGAWCPVAQLQALSGTRAELALRRSELGRVGTLVEEPPDDLGEGFSFVRASQGLGCVQQRVVVGAWAPGWRYALFEW